MSNRIVAVTWLDIVTRADWVGNKDAVIEEMKPIKCVTIGWEINQSGESIILADSFSADKDYGGITVIPKKVVISVKQISKKQPITYLEPKRKPK